MRSAAFGLSLPKDQCGGLARAFWILDLYRMLERWRCIKGMVTQQVWPYNAAENTWTACILSVLQNGNLALGAVGLMGVLCGGGGTSLLVFGSLWNW